MANKSKKYRNKVNKSRKHKRGGRKNNTNLTSQLTTQMAGNRFAYNTLLSQTGGQAGAPAPAPAYPFNLGSIEPTSLANALQQFGDAVQSFIHTAESTSAAATSAQAAVTAQVAASSNLTSASTALRNAFYGPSYTDDTGVPRTYDPGSANPQGLFKIIKGAPFVATHAPAPAPA